MTLRPRRRGLPLLLLHRLQIDSGGSHKMTRKEGRKSFCFTSLRHAFRKIDWILLRQTLLFPPPLAFSAKGESDFPSKRRQKATSRFTPACIFLSSRSSLKCDRFFQPSRKEKEDVAGSKNSLPTSAN